MSQFIIEDIDPNNTTKGVDFQNFKIKLSLAREIDGYNFVKGDIITYDLYNGIELFIIDNPFFVTDISSDTQQALMYNVTIVSNDPINYLNNEFLKRGTIYFKK